MIKSISGTNKNIVDLYKIKIEPNPILTKLLLENVKIETKTIVEQIK